MSIAMYNHNLFISGQCGTGKHVLLRNKPKENAYFTRMRVNSALCQVGLSQVGPGQLGPVIYGPGSVLPTFFHKGCQFEVCFIYKNVQQKFVGIMIGSIYIVGLSILFHSTGPTSLL